MYNYIMFSMIANQYHTVTIKFKQDLDSNGNKISDTLSAIEDLTENGELNSPKMSSIIPIGTIEIPIR